MGQRLSDVPKSEDTECLAGKLRPERWHRRTDGPPALPLTTAQLGIDAPERARERNHRADDVFGNPGFMPVNVRQVHTGTQCTAINPVEASARHLDQSKMTTSLGHLLREAHRNEHVDVGKTKHDACLVILRDHLARNRQLRLHGICEPNGDRPGKRDLHP